MNSASDEAKASVLNLLLRTCVDGQEGYRLAGDAITDGELKTILARYVTQRERFRLELKIFLRELAAPPEEEPTLTGELHHGWINLKAVAKDGNARAILVECVRGEAGALERYQEALSGGVLAGGTSAVVQRQAMEIQHAHDQMEFLSQQIDSSA